MNTPASLRIDLSQPSACLCAAVRHAARTLSSAWDGALADEGLTGTQFTLLDRLRQTGPVAITGLAAAIGIDRTTLSRTLRPLQARGLVAAQASSDRRVRPIAITDQGTEVLVRAEATWRQVQASAVGALGPDRAGELLVRLAEVERAAEAVRRGAGR